MLPAKIALPSHTQYLRGSCAFLSASHSWIHDLALEGHKTKAKSLLKSNTSPGASRAITHSSFAEHDTKLGDDQLNERRIKTGHRKREGGSGLESEGYDYFLMSSGMTR